MAKKLRTVGLEAVMGSFGGDKSAAAETTHKEQAPEQGSVNNESSASGKRGRPVGSGKNGPVRRAFSAKIKEDHYQKLGSVAYWDRRSMQDVLDEVLEEYFSKYEASRGKIQIVKE